MNDCRFFCLILLLLFLTACAEQTTKSVVLVPVEERNSPTNNKSATVESEVVRNKTTKTVNKQQEPVIIALLADADKFIGQGQSAKAAATIERALRIEPRNALLWHRLAVVRLQQQQWQQAIVMARKSNALAGHNSSLKSENWGLIAKAYDKLGDKRKANEARNKQTDQS